MEETYGCFSGQVLWMELYASSFSLEMKSTKEKLMFWLTPLLVPGIPCSSTWQWGQIAMSRHAGYG